MRLLHLFIASVLGCVPLAVSAAMGDSEPAPAVDKLATARKLLTQKNWGAAQDELRRLNDTASADWNNLMGYSLRKAKSPDLAGAERHYEAALRIDPRHRGALEYSGELFLMKGDLAQAQQRLAALEKACAGCEELSDLRHALERFKAAGNKYVAAP